MVRTFATRWCVYWVLSVSTLGQREVIEGMGEVARSTASSDTELGRSGNHGWFCPRVFLEHAKSIISHSCLVRGETMWWRTRWTMAFDCISILDILLSHAVEATAGYGQVMRGEKPSVWAWRRVSQLQKKRSLMQRESLEKSKKCVGNLDFRWLKNWDKKPTSSLDPWTRGTGKLVIVPELRRRKLRLSIPLQEIKDF